MWLFLLNMFLPAAASPTPSSHLSGHQAESQAIGSKAWPGSKIAAITLGTILGVLVLAILLCFVIYKLYWFILDIVLEEVKSALAMSHNRPGTSNNHGPVSSTNPPPTSPDDRTISRQSSPTHQAPPPSPQGEENRRQQSLEDSTPIIHIMTPQVPITLPHSLSRSEHPGSGRRAPPPSPQWEGRQRQRTGEYIANGGAVSSRGSNPPRRNPPSHAARYVAPFVTSEPASRCGSEQDVGRGSGILRHSAT